MEGRRGSSRAARKRSHLADDGLILEGLEEIEVGCVGAVLAFHEKVGFGIV